MKFSVERSQSTRLWLIFGGPVLVTLYFNSRLRDPFNSPKFMILLLLGCWLAGHLVSNRAFFYSNAALKSYLLLSLLFLSLFLLAAIISADKYTSFIGVYQRRNGFLTYLSLILLSLSAALFVKFNHLKRLFNLILTLSVVLAIYGFAQYGGRDFINWNNPYNSIISTVGNPNFAAAVMGILATISFCLAFVSDLGRVRQVLFLFLCFALIILITLSNSRQGLLAFGLGISVFLVYLIYFKSKKIGLLALCFVLVLGLLSVLGMLQRGPFAEILYKPSVSVRGYYWRAAIEMIRDYPFFGVGIDRYGSFFREYREVEYPLTYGFSISTTNAHNVPLQITSTGGIFLGIIYVTLMIFILITAIKKINYLSTDFRVVYLAIFAGWLAFQAQSIISIDNIGISVWGWLLAGLLIGLDDAPKDKISSRESIKPVKSKQLYDFKQLSFSIIFIIPAMYYVSNAYSAESNMWRQPALVQPVPNTEFYNLARQTLDNPFSDPVFKLETAFNLYQSKYVQEAKIELDQLVSSDPRNVDALSLSADFYGAQGNFDKAIELRQILAKQDPYGAINYLQLGILYKTIGDSLNQQSMLDKILSFAPLTIEAQTAKKELGVG